MNAHTVWSSFTQQRLLLQLAALLVLLLMIGGLAFMLERGAATKMRALERARVTAAMAEAVGVWASRYRGVWVFNDPAGPAVEVGEFLDHRLARAEAHGATSKAASSEAEAQALLSLGHAGGTFHRKVPSLVQREVSEVYSKLAASDRFRITSDRLVDTRHAPNRFEAAAIGHLRRAGASSVEYYEVVGDTLMYARRLTADSMCLSCHVDERQQLPVLRQKFPKAQLSDVAEGSFAGVISVSLPLEPKDGALADGPSRWPMWAAAAAGLLTLSVTLLWFQSRVARRVSELNDALTLALGIRGEASSRNELDRLSSAIKALSRAGRVGLTHRG
ncbi:MAG TPA: DUF3365 domain-containing protein [Albitalea sp.]|uniref:c-type heme family protein n=1 Tax=Piscinibacter sp. TaxID=1903157 RepID=UPI002ED242C8